MNKEGHVQRLAKILVREIGDRDAVKRLSQELKELGIVDLSNPQVAEKILSPEGAGLIFTLTTFSQFGLLNKIIEIKQKIKEL